MTTLPNTDLWQMTFTGTGIDNAPVLQAKTCERSFTFTVKVSFEASGLYACSPRDNSFTAVFTDMDFQVTKG